MVEHAKVLATDAKTVEDLRCAQAVLLPALMNATLEQTAVALGVGRASVGRYQAKVRTRLRDPAKLPVNNTFGRYELSTLTAATLSPAQRPTPG